MQVNGNYKWKGHVWKSWGWKQKCYMVSSLKILVASLPFSWVSVTLGVLNKIFRKYQEWRCKLIFFYNGLIISIVWIKQLQVAIKVCMYTHGKIPMHWWLYCCKGFIAGYGRTNGEWGCYGWCEFASSWVPVVSNTDTQGLDGVHVSISLYVHTA